MQRTTIEHAFRLGVPSVILAVLVVGCWNVVSAFGPDVHAALRAGARNLDIMSENLPRMQESLRSIAEDLPSLHKRVESIEEKLERALKTGEGR